MFTAPLKKESKAAITMLKDSSHYCIMITGDSPLTACFVAHQLKIAKKLLILTKSRKDSYFILIFSFAEKNNYFSRNTHPFSLNLHVSMRGFVFNLD